jgi:hypothetical protein
MNNLKLLGVLALAGALGQPAFAASKKAPQQTEDSVYYPNCSAARAAGAAPIRVGKPGYRRKLDRDGDGVACE